MDFPDPKKLAEKTEYRKEEIRRKELDEAAKEVIILMKEKADNGINYVSEEELVDITRALAFVHPKDIIQLFQDKGFTANF